MTAEAAEAAETAAAPAAEGGAPRWASALAETRAAHPMAAAFLDACGDAGWWPKPPAVVTSYEAWEKARDQIGAFVDPLRAALGGPYGHPDEPPARGEALPPLPAPSQVPPADAVTAAAGYPMDGPEWLTEVTRALDGPWPPEDLPAQM